MHTRNSYLERIQPFIGKPVVKVITGLRRAGKSCFLRQIMKWLKTSHNVPASHILSMDRNFGGDIKDIRRVNLIDFLLGSEKHY